MISSLSPPLSPSTISTHTHTRQMTIPPKFIDGCQGDMVEARRRWDITRAWREEYDLDGILAKPHPTFDVIKK